MAAQLALDRSALMLGGTPSLWDSREFTALLDAVQQRFAGRNGRQDQWYAAGKRRLDMLDRVGRFDLPERRVDDEALFPGNDAGK